MNGFSETVATWSDAQLEQRYREMAAKWWLYASPATDSHYLYVAILEERKARGMKI
jgi:hypothetical protein